jgi:hypothetical protein
MNNFPQNIRSHVRFPELALVVTAIKDHKAMRVEEPHTLNNTIQMSLVATVCFYGSLTVTLKGAVDQLCGKSPFAVTRRTDFLHLILELAAEELATDNIPTRQGGFSPHFVPMFEAAEDAGIDLSAVECLLTNLTVGVNMEEACLNSGFCKELREYLVFSEQCAQNFLDSFATIALRELTLAEIFQYIVDSLPQDSRYDRYRRFLSDHIALDGGERKEGDNHGVLMAKALEGIEDIDRAIDRMIRFYGYRLAVYDRCLQPEPLF